MKRISLQDVGQSASIPLTTFHRALQSGSDGLLHHCHKVPRLDAKVANKDENHISLPYKYGCPVCVFTLQCLQVCLTVNFEPVSCSHKHYLYY